MSGSAPILFVTNMMPPLVGGTPTLYDRMAHHAAPAVHVLSAWRDPDLARPIPGWRESDDAKAYPIRRVAWLRPPRVEALRRRIGLFDLLLIDFPVMIFALAAVILAALRIRARTIVIGELQGLGWLALLLGWITPWRIVMYTHGEEVVQTAYNRLARLRGPALRSSNLVLTVSSFTSTRLINDFGVEPGRIRLVTPGVDLDRFTPAERSEPFILGVGRLIERKGFDRLIDAFVRIAGAFPDYTLKIVGSGPCEADLKARAAASGHAGRIVFPGAVDDAALVALYRSCTLFAMPNRTLADGDTEGFGLIFLEANACGKPVVGGRAGGATDAIADGVTGLLVDGDDPASIADALRTLLSDEALRHRLAAGGVAHARRHGWPRSAERFLAAVRS